MIQLTSETVKKTTMPMPHQNPCQQKAPTGTAPLPLDETGRVDLERLQLPRGISITRLSRAPKETFYCSCGQGFDERPLLQTHQQKCPKIKEMATVIKFRKFSPKITKICPIGLQEFNALLGSNDEDNNISGPDLCDDDLMADTDVDIDLYDDMKSELLSENNESNDVANNWTTVRSSKRSSLIAKITPDDVGMDTSEESGLKSSTPDKLGNNLSFHCKDLVLGKLFCDYCSYTNFSKRRMINHLKKKHQWTEPTFVTLAEEDIIISEQAANTSVDIDLYADMESELPSENFDNDNIETEGNKESNNEADMESEYPSENFDNIKTEGNESDDWASNNSGLDFEDGEMWENGDKPFKEGLLVVEHADKICTVAGLHPNEKRLLEEAGIKLLHHDRGPKFGQYACQKPTKTLIDALESIGYVFYQRYEYPGTWMEPIPCPTVYEAEKLK